ncbi:X-ray repair cross-complementing protein 5-like isoform X1 [Gordionus sp. m RMFG-2023]|uniref:X-ray repair cross-complementing protein 5-like isoform X1 n=2 Tax=Gordionus sp. m RMFG-2023 TaxID=3053472 RepID=UPI0031FCA6B1
MFQTKDDAKSSPIYKSLKAIRDWMLCDIISNEKNLVCLILFHSEKTKNSNNFKHIFIYQEFDHLGAESIKKIEKFMKDIEKEIINFPFGHHNKDNNYQASIAESLWICSNQFIHSKYKMGPKKIYIFTCQDNPHSDDPHLRKQAIQRARDANESDIDIQLIGFSDSPDGKGTASDTFDMSKFYKELLTLNDEEVENYPTSEELLDELESRLRIRDYRKRAVSKLPFNIGPTTIVAVSLYALVSSTKIPAPIKLDKDTLEEIRKDYAKVEDKEGVSAIETPKERRYMEFGGGKIIFDVEEIKNLKDFGPPGITLVGFKPASFIKPYWFVRPCHFIYPDDSRIYGSSKLLRVLILRCLAKEVVAICSLISRKYSVPRMVALIPQLEDLNSEGLQMEPPGFHVKYLPYAEDFRKLSYPDNSKYEISEKVASASLEKAKEIVRRLKFTYSVTNFENPVLQRHYRVLEALALDRPSIKAVDKKHAFVDSTLPNFKIIEERLAKPVAEFKKILNLPTSQSEDEETESAGSSKRKQKVELDIKKDLSHIRQCYENNEFPKMTIPILKEYCSLLKIQKSSGNKASFVKTLNTYFQKYDKK